MRLLLRPLVQQEIFVQCHELLEPTQEYVCVPPDGPRNQEQGSKQELAVLFLVSDLKPLVSVESSLTLAKSGLYRSSPSLSQSVAIPTSSAFPEYQT